MPFFPAPNIKPGPSVAPAFTAASRRRAPTARASGRLDRESAGARHGLHLHAAIRVVLRGPAARCWMGGFKRKGRQAYARCFPLALSRMRAEGLGHYCVYLALASLWRDPTVLRTPHHIQVAGFPSPVNFCLSNVWDRLAVDMNAYCT